MNKLSKLNNIQNTKQSKTETQLTKMLLQHLVEQVVLLPKRFVLEFEPNHQKE